MSRPFDELSPKLAALLVTAAHQVEYSRGAPEAQVHLAVDASRVVGEARASGMVNAVLRRFVAQRAELLAHGRRRTPPGATRIRAGWSTRSRAAWAERTVDPAGGEQPASADGTAGRSGAAQRADDFLRAWRALGREAHAVDWNPDGVVLEHPAAVQLLPGFESGAVSVQDCAAQLAAPLLDAQAGMRVLDACAAPGGKTLHIAQRTPDLGELVAVEIDPLRLQRVRENLERGGPRCAADHRGPAALGAVAGAPLPSIACWWTRPVRPPA